MLKAYIILWLTPSTFICVCVCVCVCVCSQMTWSDFADSHALSFLKLLLQTGQDFSMLVGFLFHLFQERLVPLTGTNQRNRNGSFKNTFTYTEWFHKRDVGKRVCHGADNYILGHDVFTAFISYKHGGPGKNIKHNLITKLLILLIVVNDDYYRVIIKLI